MSKLGWVGKKVGNTDGREGRICNEFAGVGFAGLSIQVNGTPRDSEHPYVQLNSTGTDSGETGWSWWCDNFSGGARYIPLGDHWEG